MDTDDVHNSLLTKTKKVLKKVTLIASEWSNINKKKNLMHEIDLSSANFLAANESYKWEKNCITESKKKVIFFCPFKVHIFWNFR